jgi:hypothetical protein
MFCKYILHLSSCTYIVPAQYMRGLPGQSPVDVSYGELQMDVGSNILLRVVNLTIVQYI